MSVEPSTIASLLSPSLLVALFALAACDSDSTPIVQATAADGGASLQLAPVRKPGNYPYVSDMTAVNAVAMAGGFTYRARKNDFYIKRLDTDGKMVRIEAKSGTVLRPGDTLEVRERLF
jgi:hypothetical protein